MGAARWLHPSDARDLSSVGELPAEYTRWNLSNNRKRITVSARAPLALRFASSSTPPMKFLRLVALPAVLALFGGCSSLNTRSVVSLADFKHVYVVHRLTDDHHVDEMLVHEL